MANPTVNSIIMSNTALILGQTSTVTITFSEPVIGFSNADVTAQNGTLTTLTSGDGGITWTATFTPDLSTDSNSNLIIVGPDYTNLLGEPGSTAISSNYTIDTITPDVNSIVMSNSDLKVGMTSNVTITFSEAVNLDNSDVTSQNGTLSPLTSSDGGVTWTSVFTPNPNVESATDVITVANYTDLSGNTGPSATSANYTIDTLAPTVSSIAMSDTSLNIGATSNVTITFSQPVMGFSNSDVTVQNGTLSTLTSSDGGLTWTGVFTPNSGVQSTTDVITVDSNYTDLSGNQGSGATSANYTVDTIAPSVSSIIMDNTNLNIGETSNLTITFSEAVTGFNNSDVTVQNGTLSSLSSSDGGVTWTGVFTPNSGVQSTTDVITVGSNYTDLAGNQGTGATSANYTVDTLAPSVSSIVMSDTALIIGETSNVTITFSEAVMNFSNADVTAQNGTLSTLTSSDGGLTWTGVFTPNSGVQSATDVITVGSNYTDLAGNQGTGATSANYTVDTLAPSVSSIVMSDTDLSIGETSNVTITFSTPVTGFNNSDVTVQNGTLSTLTSSDGGLTWTGVFTPNSDVQSTANVVTVGSNYTDLSGNQGTGATSANYTIDTVAPSVSSIVMSDSALNIGETSNVTITFSTPVTGFSNSDVTVQNGTLSTLTSSDGGLTWTGVFTPNSGVQSTTNVLTVSSNYTDLSGNQGTGATSANYTIDTVAPTVNSIIMSDTNLGVGETSNVTITFSEAVTNFSNADVTVQNGTLSTLTSSDGGVTWAAVFTPTADVKSLTDVITVGANYTDLSGNQGSSAVSANYIVNTTISPTVSSIVMSDTALKMGETSNVTITFSEPVTNFSNADVTVQNGTLSTLTSSDGGVTWAAVFTPNVGIQSATATIIVSPNYTDINDNPGTGATGPNYSVDTLAPTVSSIVMSDSSLKNGETSNLTITFSEPVTGFNNSDVTVENGTLSTLSSSNGGLTWTAVFTPTANTNDNTNVVTVGPNYTDLAGNAGSGAISANYTIDTIAPSVNSITLSQTALNIGATSNVTITFSEVVNLDNSDVIAGNGMVANLSTQNGTTWTGLLIPNCNVESANNVITISNYTDLAGNVGSNATSGNYSIDTKAPFVNQLAMSDPYLTSGNISVLTIGFSEPVTNFSNSDVTVEHGTLSTLTSHSGGMVWTGTFIPTRYINDSFNTITIDSTYTDLAGNPGSGLAVSSYIINTIPGS